MESLRDDGNAAIVGTYKGDGAASYFDLNTTNRQLVDNRVEEICIATRVLSISSNKKFSASKQELKNDLVKGKDNYPRTIPGVLNFLANHVLSSNKTSYTNKNETIFINNEDTQSEPASRRDVVSKTCTYWENGTCDYKEKHKWSACPRNQFSKNLKKKCNDKGEIIMCTIEEMESFLDFDDDDLESENENDDNSDNMDNIKQSI